MELQQRAVEYMSLERKPDLARSNVVAMPPWEKRKSLLLRRMAAREVHILNPNSYFQDTAPGRSASRCCCTAWPPARCGPPLLEANSWVLTLNRALLGPHS